MIGFIVAGLIIGLLARLILPGKQHIGLLWTLVLGVVGSVIGGSIANLIGSGDIMELNVFGFIMAVIAAVLLLSAAERAGLSAGRQRGRLGRG
ncbi:MAG TPA: GlsB/YeaQ/YmgE family stress response membrane protein [Solirubrobacteraceae bacterium]|nr:GlsB/YeaQ/YmgE family stress response membrane protein [Solirubrobacteraceae bacterium]